MKILVACEESQAVTIELRKLGHEAYSNDLIECSGGHPEWHIDNDAAYMLDGNGVFSTQDGISHTINGKWDMIIAFPPCTYLTVSGLHWNKKNPERAKKTEEAIKFFMLFAYADCDKIAIENPVGCISSRWRKPNQTIHPYQFGSDASKRTCLWLKGLMQLTETSYVEPRIVDGKKRWSNQSDDGQNVTFDENGKLCPWNSDKIKKLRSKTYPGIAKAMAEQWAGDINKKD
jgi:hypothetical protein